jgi:hypothetical protein
VQATVTADCFPGASVMIITEKDGEPYMLLGREHYGKNAGKYSDWGGARAGFEKAPLQTAAREFHEEAILKKTLGLSLAQTEKIIAPSSPYLIMHAALHKPAALCKHIFLLQLPYEYVDAMIKSFYRARSRSFFLKYREKDQIALVAVSNLVKESIGKKPHYVVPAIEYLKNGTAIEKKINLTDFFMESVYPIFATLPYTYEEETSTHCYLVL